MRKDIVIMNFTHVYEQERFMDNLRFKWLDCTDLYGTDCYCDEQAAQEIKARISSFSP